MWPFRKKKTAEESPLKKYRLAGFSSEEGEILARLDFVVDLERWTFSYRKDNVRWCPYCGGIVVELSSEKKIKPPGSARAVVGAVKVHYGFFCIKCGAELICGEPNCKYKRGNLLVDRTSHFNTTGRGHRAFKIMTRRGAQNLFDLLDRLEARDKVLGSIEKFESIKIAEDEPDLQDEYKNLEARLEEIAAEKLDLEERMHEINVAFEQEALELAEPPKELMAAADGDKEIIAAAEEEVAQLAPAADEGEK